MRRAGASASLLLWLAACSGPSTPAPAPQAAAATPTPDPSRPLPLPLPEVVARVNGQEIRIRQILPLAKAALDRYPASERDKHKAAVVRRALDDFITRELLLQEALARGVAADTRLVERNYDQIRGQYPAEADWTAFLEGQGMDAQSFKNEVRVQATVAALVARDLEEWPVPEAEARAFYSRNPRAFAAPEAAEPPSFEEARKDVELAVRRVNAVEIQAALVARLKARARIELYI